MRFQNDNISFTTPKHGKHYDFLLLWQVYAECLGRNITPHEFIRRLDEQYKSAADFDGANSKHIVDLREAIDRLKEWGNIEA